MPKDKTGCHICKHAKTENLHGRQEVRCCLDDMLVMRPSKGCNYCEKKALSNADRIRQMADEELAEWLDLHGECNQCAYHPAQCKTKCNEGHLKWLKQEVQNNDG